MGAGMEYNQAISAVASSRAPSAPSTSDETLLGLIAKGDRNAVRLLFVRHNVRVYRFILRIVGNEMAAEDLVNEVFIEVWRSAHRFESRSQVTTWILGIARFKALTALRRRPSERLDEDFAESIEDSSDNPEMLVQKADRSAILQACLKQLSNAHRQVIDLVYYHEQSIEEVARIIGVPENTVKTRAFHARKRLAELIEARGLEAMSL
jgi:RNA polymerase sigma-70 factor (ECF subfamily)